MQLKKQLKSLEQRSLSNDSLEILFGSVSLSLSCYRQARYWLERYPLPILFTSGGEQKE